MLMKGGGGIFAEYFGGDFSDVIVGGMNLGMEVTVKKTFIFFVNLEFSCIAFTICIYPKQTISRADFYPLNLSKAKNIPSRFVSFVLGSFCSVTCRIFGGKTLKY